MKPNHVKNSPVEFKFICLAIDLRCGDWVDSFLFWQLWMNSVKNLSNRPTNPTKRDAAVGIRSSLSKSGKLELSRGSPAQQGSRWGWDFSPTDVADVFFFAVFAKDVPFARLLGMGFDCCPYPRWAFRLIDCFYLSNEKSPGC